jgi:hypothetical protein
MCLTPSPAPFTDSIDPRGLADAEPAQMGCGGGDVYAALSSGSPVQITWSRPGPTPTRLIGTPA